MSGRTLNLGPSGHVDDFTLLANHFGGKVLGFSVGSQVAAEAHGNGAGGDFGEACENDEVCRLQRARETSGQSERNGQAVGETNDNVADKFAGAGMTFIMLVECEGLGFHEKIVSSSQKTR